LGTEAGKKAKAELDKKLSGKEVRCTVQARDTYGRVVADVEVLKVNNTLDTDAE